MPWFKVDDNLALHTKTVAAGNAAMGLWVRAGSWCAQQLSDGFVPEHVMKTLGKRSEARRLVDAGLWSAVDGGYQFHEWSERQPSRADVEEKRRKSAERLAKWRAERAAGNGGCNATSNSVTPAFVTPLVTPPPTRPDPTRPDPTTSVLRTDVEGGVGGELALAIPAVPPAPPVTPTTSTRGIRLPDGWTPPADVISAMRIECPGFDLHAEHVRFVDYWQAQPGQKGLKAGERGWQATWRNWMRRAYTDQRRPAGTAPSAPRGKPTMDDIVRENAIRYQEMRLAEQAEDLAKGGRP